MFHRNNLIIILIVLSSAYVSAGRYKWNKFRAKNNEDSWPINLDSAESSNVVEAVPAPDAVKTLPVPEESPAENTDIANRSQADSLDDLIELFG